MPSLPEVTFSSGSESICVDIATIDDNIVESEQTFTVHLNTAQERVTFTRNNTLVTINDNDGRRVQCGML